MPQVPPWVASGSFARLVDGAPQIDGSNWVRIVSVTLEKPIFVEHVLAGDTDSRTTTLSNFVHMYEPVDNGEAYVLMFRESNGLNIVEFWRGPRRERGVRHFQVRHGQLHDIMTTEFDTYAMAETIYLERVRDLGPSVGDLKKAAEPKVPPKNRFDREDPV